MKKLNIWVSVSTEIYEEFRFEEYLLHLKIQWLAYQSLRYYIGYIKNFIEYSKFNNIEDFNNILKLRFAYYSLSEKGITNNTIWKYYKCVRKYYLFLKEIEVSEKILIDEMKKVKVIRSLPKSLSEEQVIQIRESLKAKNKRFIDMRDYVVFETFLNTWVRRAELQNLRIKDVYKGYLKVHKGKWNKDRIVYISNTFSRLISDYIALIKEKEILHEDSYLFGGLSLEWVSLLIRRISRLSKIKFSPHLLRHTYASLCILKWVNLYTLQRQLWHSDLKTTSVYLYLNSKENWAEVQKLDI